MQRGLTILKFGGSVLDDGRSYGRAVSEIHRWRRAGDRVVAVVSAASGETERLLREAGELCAEDDPHALAHWLAGGEERSAARLALHLARAGIGVRVLDAAALGLVADGDPLDAEPVRLDPARVEVAHAADEVVVVPGFAARDVGGRTVLLGRGGSDSTALFLAEALRATRCRLVKDVDGLYEWDPAREGPRPRRYASLGYADALRTDGTIVQHKAIERAWSLGVAFEVAGLGRRHRTVVGASTVLASEEDDEAPRPLRVSLLGRGTVGAGVEALVAAEPERFELGPVLVRDVAGRPAAERLTADGEWAVAGAEVVVEALGGVEPARTLVARALAAGAHVVTANKALIAEHGPELLALARASGVRLLCSASVGGCMPLLERIPSGAPVRRVRGVLNGTVNAVLDSVARGASFERAVASAQAVGLAESDPTRDLDGRDAADKLAVIACALGAELDPKSVRRESLDEAVVARARDAAQARGSRLRQVSTLWLDGDVPRGSVGFEECAPGTALGSCVGPGNAALVERDDGSLERVAGIGAGRWPTAEAVLGDLHALARETPRRNPARATG